MKLSIITINFNNRDGLRKTIESVVNQTWQEFEYIIIDGGSTDGSVEVIKEYADRIDYWVSEPDKGIYNAMNKGIDQAKGEYSLFLNSGDCLTNNAILQEIRHDINGEDIVMGLLKVVPSNRIAYTDIVEPITFCNFYKGNPISHPSSFVKTSLCNRLRYDEEYKIVSDWKFFLQALVMEHCSYKIIDKVITDFQEGGISDNRAQCEQEKEQILKLLIPQRILMDYQFSMTGFAYTETPYDRLFVQIRKTRFRKFIYTTTICILKIISCLSPRAKIFREYPYHTK